MKLVLNTTMNKLNPFAELICFISKPLYAKLLVHIKQALVSSEETPVPFKRNGRFH